MKRAHSLIVMLLVSAQYSMAHSQALFPDQDPTKIQTVNRTAKFTESLLIGRGDLLHVIVFREPDLEQKVRVKDSGEIDLDLAGALNVAGLTPGDAAKAIAQLYLQGHYLNHPQVSVLVEEYATQSVSVLGQVNKPGAVTLTTPRSLLDVLSLSGGLTEIADRHITLKHRDKSESTTVFLPNDATASLHADVTVYPGDTVLVPKAGIVYVLGDVARPGGYVMQDDAKLTVLQAMAMASGANRTAKESAARLIRKVNGSYQEQIVSLQDIERGKKPDMPLDADDVLYVPFSMAKNVVLGASGIVSSTSSAAIYAAR
jgi:polysaccharide export outer membrane protein